MVDLEQLTPQEREWAFDLEEAIYESGDEPNGHGSGSSQRRGERLRSRLRGRNTSASASIGNVRAMTEQYGKPSDFEIVAHALRAKGNIPRALKRLQRMKIFKDSCNIPEFDTDTDTGDSDFDPLEPTLNLMKKFLTSYPLFIQKIGMDKHGRVTLSFRLEGLRWSQPPPFNHTDTERFQAIYYLLHATQPTLESIRRGTVWIGDLEGITERPSAPLFRGGRMLLRDSYPIKVEDIPVVDCPPRFSRVFATTYPFMSSHFVSKLVRVTPNVLRNHFPPELLSDRMRGIRNEKNTTVNPRRFRYKDNGSNECAKKQNVDVIADSDENGYGNTWENLDDDDDDEDYEQDYGSHSHSSEVKDVSNGSSYGENDDQIEQLWIRIERLLRMRFETERTFRIS